MVKETGEIKVSVIVPVLNGGKFFKKALDSVLNQSLKEIEVIIVDAGSTDGTLEVIADYRKIDARIRLIGSNRKSMGYQYNLGIESARGKYIGFVEADDFASSEMFGHLFELAESNNVDIAKADWYSVYRDKKVLRRTVDIDSLYGVRLKEVPIESFLNVGEFGHWSGIYRRNYLIKYDIRFNETRGASFQDLGFYFLLYAMGGSALFIDTPFYCYRKDNPDSSIHDDSRVWCYFDEFEYVMKRLVEKKLGDYGGALARYFFDRFIWALRRIKKEEQLEFLTRFSADYKELARRGLLSKNCFAGNDEQIFLDALIKHSPSIVWEMMKKRTEELILRLSENEHLIVVGKAMAAKWFINRVESRVKIFANITSAELNQFSDYKENSLIVIAAKSDSVRKEIENNVIQSGFESYQFIPVWMV